jgi:hypothetical protein
LGSRATPSLNPDLLAPAAKLRYGQLTDTTWVAVAAGRPASVQVAVTVYVPTGQLLPHLVRTIEFTCGAVPGTVWDRGAPDLDGDDRVQLAPPNPSMMKVKFFPCRTE